MAKKSKADPRKAFLQSSIEAAQKQFNSKNIYIAADHKKRLYGIPLPCLALEYLFTSNVFLMSRMVGLAGSFGSCKSSFGFEILRWFIEWGGMANLVETEGKLSEQFGNVLQDSAPYAKLHLVDSTQDAQSSVTFSKAEHIESKEVGHLPMAQLIDSLTGSEGENTKKSIDDEGSASKGYPENALIWSTWFRKNASEYLETPITLVYTNHLKKNISATGPASAHAKTKAGGDAQDFHATYYFFMNKLGALKTVARHGIHVQFKTHKNSMGPGDGTIDAEFCWYYKDDDPQNQISYWDWYAATSKWLVNPKTPSTIQSVVRLKATANKYSSSVLGFSGLSATEAGYFIENCPIYVEALRAAMHTQMRNVWVDGKIVDYKKCKDRVDINLPPNTISDELKANLAAANKSLAEAVKKQEPPKETEDKKEEKK